MLFFGQINSGTGKMGKAVGEAAVSAGLQLVPVTFSDLKGFQEVEVAGTKVRVHSLSEREHVLSSVLKEFPDLVIIDFTVPDAVNGMMYLRLFIFRQMHPHVMSRIVILITMVKIITGFVVRHHDFVSWYLLCRGSSYKFFMCKKMS